MRTQDTLRLIGLAVLWSFSFLFIRASVDAFGAAGVVILRVGIAALVLHAVARITRQALSLQTHWRHYLVLGFFQTALPFFLFALALKDIGASLGSIVNATSPLFGLIIAIALGDEAPRWQRILGIAGVVALVGIDSPTQATNPTCNSARTRGYRVIRYRQQLHAPVCAQRTGTWHGHL